MKKIFCVDLFCGAGGLTHGFVLEGLPVVAGIDLDPACRFPYEANNQARFVEQDIGKVTALIRAHILLEDAVAKVPAPQIKVTQTSSDLTAFAVSIAYNDAQTNTPTVLSFNVSQ